MYSPCCSICPRLLAIYSKRISIVSVDCAEFICTMYACAHPQSRLTPTEIYRIAVIVQC